MKSLKEIDRCFFTDYHRIEITIKNDRLEISFFNGETPNELEYETYVEYSNRDELLKDLKGL